MSQPHKPLDDYARHCIAEAPNVIVSWWMMASFLYYRRDISLLTDAYYDNICRVIAERWEAIEHPHKHLIERDALRAGTGYYLGEKEYPQRVKYAAEYILNAGAPRMPALVDELEAPGGRPPPPRKVKPQGELFG